MECGAIPVQLQVWDPSEAPGARRPSLGISSPRSALWRSTKFTYAKRPEHIEMARGRVIEGEADVTHMHYRVQR